MTIGKALQTICIRSVPKKVHRRLWTPFGTEPIKNGSVPTFLFSFQRVNARPFFGTVLLRFLRARGHVSCLAYVTCVLEEETGKYSSTLES